MAKNDGNISEEVINKTVDKMFVLFGCEILKIVPGNQDFESLYPIV
jgi:hypothetical protein